MEDAHSTLSIDSHVKLASRSTVAEASAFMQPFNLTIETEFKSDRPVQIRYFHRRTQRSRRVTASSIEMEDDPARSWSQQLTGLFPRAMLEGKKLVWSFCDSAKVDDQALVLCPPNGPFGNLDKLPRELRDEIYRHAFPRTFWQCYHTKLPGITLLDVTHSSTLPVLLDVSQAVREEVLESVFCDTSLAVVIGTEVITFNFPLHPPLLAGQTLDDTQVRLP